MAITREEFFNKKANASLWDVAVSIKRGNPLPLDADSIFESYAALETYAADVLAYPGQLVAVVEENSTGIYYLDQNLAIQPVGVIPTGDNKSIEVSAEGAISLLVAADAENGTVKNAYTNEFFRYIVNPILDGDNVIVSVQANENFSYYIF